MKFDTFENTIWTQGRKKKNGKFKSEIRKYEKKNVHFKSDIVYSCPRATLAKDLQKTLKYACK